MVANSKLQQFSQCIKYIYIYIEILQWLFYTKLMRIKANDRKSNIKILFLSLREGKNKTQPIIISGSRHTRLIEWYLRILELNQHIWLIWSPCQCMINEHTIMILFTVIKGFISNFRIHLGLIFPQQDQSFVAAVPWY